MTHTPTAAWLQSQADKAAEEANHRIQINEAQRHVGAKLALRQWIATSDLIGTYTDGDTTACALADKLDAWGATEAADLSRTLGNCITPADMAALAADLRTPAPSDADLFAGLV